MQNTVQQNQVRTQPQIQTAPQNSAPQNCCVTPPQGQPQQCAPQVQAPVTQQYYVPQPQQGGKQTPNYAGVNIQIFNPSVTTPGSAAPVYNVNAPTYGNGQNANANSNANGCYPPNYYTQQFTKPQGSDVVNNITNNTTNKEENKKTEKRQIVQLTDDYIKTLENYLNSQDKEVRMMGAKEVVARLQEDDSRKDDLALTALVNKMIQDPYQGVKMLGLAVLDSRQCTGNDYTVGVLQNMQSGKTGYGQDAKTATEILLKMSGKTVEKEFEVKDKPKTEDKK